MGTQPLWISTLTLDDQREPKTLHGHLSKKRASRTRCHAMTDFYSESGPTSNSQPSSPALSKFEENGLHGDPRIKAISDTIRVVPYFSKEWIMFQDIRILLLDQKAFKYTVVHCVTLHKIHAINTRFRHCIITMSRDEGDERALGLQALIVVEPLILSVEDRVGLSKDDVLGRCMLPLQYVDRRLYHKAINTRWFNLEKHVMVVEEEKKKEVKFASKIHMIYINPINGP
ncbi:hypothetical protein Tco_0543742 [Tanacetum coccineum]